MDLSNQFVVVMDSQMELRKLFINPRFSFYSLTRYNSLAQVVEE